MLTVDVLKKQKALESLPDDVLTLIAQLSKNDEDTVIGEKIGDLHRRYDEDIFAATGKRKPSGEHTYEWLKGSLLPELKAKAEQYDLVVSSKTVLENKVRTLEEQIKSGSTDETLKAQMSELQKVLADEKARVSGLTTELTKLQTETLEKESKFNQNLARKDLEVIWSNELRGVEPIAGITKEVFDEMIAARKAAFFATTEIETTEGTGGNTTTFRRDGKQWNNPENALNPFTPKEAFHHEILRGIVAENTKKGGGGGGGAPGKKLATGNWASQVAATDGIRDQLKDQGIGIEHPDYNDKFNEAWSANGVDNLPLEA